nr:uncharacterized protein LOC117839116 [Setaria viridis]
MEKGKVKTPKAVWDAYATKIFCQICKEETLARNRLGTTLSSIGYKNLEDKFFAVTKPHYPHGKLKDKWDALKPQYNLWLDLKRDATGLGFDVQKGVITASDEWWEEKTAENKNYGKFRDAPMENLEELEVMFQNINVMGLSSVVSGVSNIATPIDVGDDSHEGEDDEPIAQDGKKEGKRKVGVVDSSHNPKKKGRNPMVKQVSLLVDVLSNSKSKNDQKVEDDIIELIDQAMKVNLYDEDINTNDTSTLTQVPISGPNTLARARQLSHQVANDKIGQLEATKIDTNTKLKGVEASVAHIDKSLAALLKCFDEMHAKTSNGHDGDNKKDEHVEDN